MQIECTLVNNEFDKLKKNNSNLWTECQHYKEISSDLNYKLRGHKALKELFPEIVKLYEEIKTLSDT